MAKNYNSSENCHNASDKNTSNKNASRNTSNKNSYGKMHTIRMHRTKTHMIKMRKTRILIITEMKTVSIRKSFPDRTCKRTSCFGVYIRYSKTY